METLTLTLHKTKDTKNKVVYVTGHAPGCHIRTVSPGQPPCLGNRAGASRRWKQCKADRWRPGIRHYCGRTYRPRMEMIVVEGRQVLGERVRALRETAGLAQENLAQAAGLGRITLVRLEKGKHARPSSAR